jgi:hypothetical protein
MRINWGDVVAVYAAVVATGALGWQIYQRRADREGRLVVSLNRPRAAGGLHGRISNSNDYPVKVTDLRVRLYTAKRMDPDRLFVPPHHVRVSLEEAALPSEVPAHDSVTFRLEVPTTVGPRFRRYRRRASVRYVKVTVLTSLHRRFSDGITIGEHPAARGQRVPVRRRTSI